MPARASNGRQASRSSSRNSSAFRYTGHPPFDSGRPESDRYRLAVLAKDGTQDGALLAERCIRLGAADEMRHEVRLARFRTRSRVSKPTERGFHGRCIALPAGAAESLELALEGARRHREHRHARHLGLIDVGVDPDDPALPRVELALIAVGRVRDLALRVALANRGDHPAATVDLVEIAPHVPLA